MDIVAVRRSIIVIIDRPTLTDYLGRHPATKDAVIRKMAQVWRWYTVAMTSLVMRPLLERISMRLIELAGSEPRRPDGLAVTPRLSQSTLASMVGVSRKNLNRALAVMMHNGSVPRRRQICPRPRERVAHTCSGGRTTALPALAGRSCA